MRLVDYAVRYGGRTVVRCADVVFPKGRISHIVGRNGEGKSTLAKAMAGLIPSEGHIEDGGESISVVGSYSCIPSDLRVGMLVDLAKRHSSGSEITYLLSRLGISALPAKRRIARLSDGQRQKLKLLFFLSSQPDIVVLDEFTSSLDAKSSAEMRAFLNSYSSVLGKTIVNITHDVADIERMPGDFFLLENGSLVHFSGKDELICRYVGREI